MLPIAALSLAGYPYTQYAARGMPPEDLAREHPEALPNNRWLAAARRVREESEDRLPARFLTLKTPARELYRVLERNEVVAMAFDGRIGHRWVRVPFLGREAVLNTGPYRLAEAMETPILPTLCRTPTRGRSVCEIGEPLRPGQGGWAALMRRFLAEHADPWLRRHPAEYGVWLAHCRLRNDVDDHPLFTDQAVDDRWRRHPSL
jgi:lauroyl/myristoyl acyltransferase